LPSPIDENRDRHSALEILLASKNPLLTCYFPVADPLVADYVVDAYADGGVNIVEMGMPTNDPWSDGYDVASSMRRAMDAETDPLAEFQKLGQRLRERAPAIANICMTYADSPVYTRSTPETFEAVDAMLVLGDESEELKRVSGTRGGHRMRRVEFVPSKFGAREIEAAKSCDAYVMLQAAEGVTGPRCELDPANEERVRRLRAAGVVQRILLGVGISTPEQARAAMGMGADGVVIGTMCLRKALEGEKALRTFLRDVRAAIDS
jgi:tryptophan synthase alpha chain